MKVSNDNSVTPQTGRKLLLALALVASAARPAAAVPVYLALGDSITFGETDLTYVPSLGDRGYVSRFADTLASRNGGTRPSVINLAIDGETASSFMTNAGRTPPVQGRADGPLQLENLHYTNNAVSQGTLLASTVAAQVAAGNTISTVSLTLGFNELAALAPAQNTPAAEAAAIARIPATIAAFRASYAAVLSEIRSLAPSANLYALGYYNPFPADPASPAAPVFAAGGTLLNAAIQDVAAQFNGIYVDNAAPFVGHEAQYTYQAVLPAGSTVGGLYGGVLPIGNVHPNSVGYDVIAADVAAATPVPVPEPASLLLLLAPLGAVALARSRRHG